MTTPSPQATGNKLLVVFSLPLFLFPDSLLPISKYLDSPAKRCHSSNGGIPWSPRSCHTNRDGVGEPYGKSNQCNPCPLEDPRDEETWWVDLDLVETGILSVLGNPLRQVSTPFLHCAKDRPQTRMSPI